MANLQPYDYTALTVASNYYKLGTVLRLRASSGRVIFVTVTDRMSDQMARANRIDGTLAVWTALGLNLKDGKVLVQVNAIPEPILRLR